VWRSFSTTDVDVMMSQPLDLKEKFEHVNSARITHATTNNREVQQQIEIKTQKGFQGTPGNMVKDNDTVIE
jgi:hypothetical protein